MLCGSAFGLQFSHSLSYLTTAFAIHQHSGARCCFGLLCRRPIPKNLRPLLPTIFSLDDSTTINMPPRASTPPPTFSLPLLSPPPAPRRGRRLNPRNRTENINRHRRYASLDSITEMSGYGWEQDVSMDVMVFDDAEDCLVVYDGGDEDESEDTRDSQDEMDVEMGFQGGKVCEIILER